MSNVTLTGFSGVLENELTEDIGEMFCVNAALIPQLEDGETGLVRVFSPATNEVMRVRMVKGLYVTIERGMQRTRATPHPVGACVQGIGQDLNACDIAAMLCADDEAIAGLAMCLDAELKISEQIALLLDNQEKNTTLLDQVNTELTELKDEYNAYVESTNTQITELQTLVGMQGEAIVVGEECCEANLQAINQLTSEINGFQTLVEALTQQLTDVQNTQQNFNVLDEFTCEELLEKCPELVPDENGGGGGGSYIYNCKGTRVISDSGNNIEDTYEYIQILGPANTSAVLGINGTTITFDSSGVAVLNNPIATPVGVYAEDGTLLGYVSGQCDLEIIEDSGPD